MSKPSASSQTNFPKPHPLAVELLARIAPGAAVLEIGRGSGRNQAALLAAGIESQAIEPADVHAVAGKFDGVLSTHALLHGTPATLQALILRIYDILKPDGMLYATVGSKRDARYGTGRAIAEHTFAPIEGDEAGVAHTYWDRDEIIALLRAFSIEELIEVPVDDIAGAWAHKQAPLSNAVHWFLVAKKTPRVD